MSEARAATTVESCRRSGPASRPITTDAREPRSASWRLREAEHLARATADDFAAPLRRRGRPPRRSWPRSDGEAVGFALFFPTFSTFRGQPGLYLEDLFVRPEHRGRGIGKALIAAVARRPSTRGCGRLEWAVLDWNAPSIALLSVARGRLHDGPLPDRDEPWTAVHADSTTNALAQPMLAALAFPSPTSGNPGDEPILPAPHRPDGRLRARRAAPRRRLHQAEHEREPVPALAPRGRGDRRRARRAAPALSRPGRHGVPRGRRAAARRRARHDPGGQRLRRPAHDHHPRLRRAGRRWSPIRRPATSSIGPWPRSRTPGPSRCRSRPTGRSTPRRSPVPGRSSRSSPTRTALGHVPDPARRRARSPRPRLPARRRRGLRQLRRGRLRRPGRAITRTSSSPGASARATAWPASGSAT